MFALRPILKAGLSASLIALLLAGCGGGGNHEAVDSPTPSDTTPIPTVPDKTPDNTARVSELTNHLSVLRGQIERLVGQAQSCQFDAECKNLEVGDFYQSCGDTDIYLAYSPPRDTNQELQKHLADYKTLDGERDHLLASAPSAHGGCMVQNPPPAVGCAYGKCTNDQQQLQAFKSYYQQLQADWERLSGEINTLVGDAQCGTALDCRSIATGDKPCGGPGSFMPYSILLTDPQQLAPKVEEFNKLAQTFNELDGSISDCTLVMPRPVACVESRCQETSLSLSKQEDIVSEQTNADSVALRSGINTLLGGVSCTSSEQCADVDIGYYGDTCSYQETIAFSMANPPDMRLLASKLKQYTHKSAEEITNLATDGKINASFSTDLQIGSCVQGQCAGHEVKSLFCNDLTGKKTTTQ